MSKIDDGGPAFPATEEVKGEEGFYPVLHPGMSLRDWFAGMLAASTLSIPNPGADMAHAAQEAYRFADAMIAARKQDGTS